MRPPCYFERCIRSDQMLPSDALDQRMGRPLHAGPGDRPSEGDHWSLVKDERNTAALARQINAVLDRYSDSRRERRALARPRSTQRVNSSAASGREQFQD